MPLSTYNPTTRTFTGTGTPAPGSLTDTDLNTARSDILADTAVPVASSTVAGKVKIGSNISVATDGTISVSGTVAGAQGPVGPQGPQGPAGPTGATGPAGTGTASAPTAPTPLSASGTISGGGTYKITTAGITVTLATPGAGTFPVYTFTLDRLAGASTATVTGPGTNSIYVGTTGQATTSVVLQGGDTWQIQWDGTYFCTLNQPLSQQLSSATAAGAGITAATVFYTNDAGTDVTYTAAQIAAFLRGPSNNYTSGAIAPTDGTAFLKATAAASYTLGNGTIDGRTITLKRTSTTTGADQAVTANIGGVSGAVLTLKTMTRGTLTIGEAATLQWSTADATYYIV